MAPEPASAALLAAGSGPVADTASVVTPASARARIRSAMRSFGPSSDVASRNSSALPKHHGFGVGGQVSAGEQVAQRQ